MVVDYGLVIIIVDRVCEGMNILSNPWGNSFWDPKNRDFGKKGKGCCV